MTFTVPPIDRRSLARHEAGHFVVAMRFGHTLDYVDIVSDGDRNGVAVSSPGSIMTANSPGILEQSAIVFLAGPEAEGRRVEASCSDSDVFAARLKLSLLSASGSGDLEQRMEIAQCWTKVFVQHWWNDIERVAAKLLIHERLTGNEVVELCGGPLVVEQFDPPLTTDAVPPVIHWRGGG